jgi:hypothetical protein
MNLAKWVIPGVLAIVGMSGIAAASDNAESRKSLSALPGVHVVVEELDQDLERRGLTRAAIQTDVEQRLRSAGVRVLTYADMLAVPGRPTLYVNASVVNGSEPWEIAVVVELQQTIRLDRDPKTVVPAAATWSTSTFDRVGPSSKVAEAMGSAIRDRIDRFINAYLAVNPKQ